ncbi:MAG: hypothetical protein R3D02_13645 [Hyphomicrobiales bacterium]
MRKKHADKDKAVIDDGAPADLPVQRRKGASRHGDAVWDEVRRLYEGGVVPVAEICRTTGVSGSGLRYRARTLGWTRRGPASPGVGAVAFSHRIGTDQRVDRSRLVERLYRALDRQMQDIEERLAGLGEGGSAGEREARTLAALARTLDKLIELEEAAGRPGEAEKVEERDRERFRAELARRLARLGGAAGN